MEKQAKTENTKTRIPLIGIDGSRILPVLSIFDAERMSVGPTDIMDKRARVHEVLHRTEIIHKGHGVMDDRYWKHSFKMIGSNIMGIIHQRAVEIILQRAVEVVNRPIIPEWAEQFKDLIMRKNSKYGDQPLIRWGPLGIMIRIDSKFSRYCNLISKLTPVEELKETIEDTLQDILGYCILGWCLVAPPA